MAQLIAIIIALFVIYYLVIFAIQIVGSLLLYVGATPILIFDYITRPFSWLNASTPDIAWGLFGLLVGLCVGLLYVSRKLVLLTLIPRFKFFVLGLIALLIALIIFAYSLDGNYGIAGSWKGYLQVGSTSLPAQLEVVKENISVSPICESNSEIYTHCHEVKRGFAGFIKIRFRKEYQLFDVQGYIIPGSNQLRLSLTPQPTSKYLANVKTLKGKVLFGLQDIVGSGDIVISGKSQPFDLSLKRLIIHKAI
jgi:hypothetical protein